MPQPSSVTRTVRLDKDVDHQLQERAQNEGVSVSQIVNKALRKLVEWDAYVSRFGFVTIPTSVHIKLFTYLTDDEAKEAGAWAGRNFARDFTMFRYKKLNLETVLKSLVLLGSDYAGLFDFMHHSEGRTHTIVLKHSSGMKTSIYNEEFLRVVFQELLGLAVKTERMEDQVMVRVVSNGVVAQTPNQDKSLSDSSFRKTRQ